MPKKTPSYISTLLQPIQSQAVDRKVWAIPLQGLWIPFFTATNTAGETAIAHEALGAPLRLQREQDGTPKFSKSGRPVVRVVKELADQIRIVRENFTYGLLNYAGNVLKTMPEEYKAQVAANMKAGEGIVRKDETDVTDFIAAKAEALVAEAERVVTSAEGNHTPASTERELVPA